MLAITQKLASLIPSRRHENAGRAGAGKIRRAAASVPCGIEQLEGRLLYTTDPGSTFATALNIGDPGGGQSYGGHVGAANQIDFYAFTMSAPGTFHGRLRAYDANTEVTLYKETDTASGPTYSLVDFRIAEASTSSDPNNFDSGNFNDVLAAGKYFVKVSEDAGESDYLVRFTPDYAGDTLATARNVGTIYHSTFYDEVGANFDSDTTGDNSYVDPLDFYKFTMARAGIFSANIALNGAFTQPTFNVEATLIKVVGNVQEIISTAHIGSPLTASLAAGSYYVRVDPVGTPYPNYALTLNADYSGSTTSNATNLGNLANSPYTASIENYNDPAKHKTDYYTFTLSQARTAITTISAFVPGGTGAQVSLYYDKNNNGQIDPGEGVDGIFSVANNAYQMADDLKAGKYFVLVNITPGQSAGNYQLSIVAKPDGAGNSLTTADNLGTVGGSNSLISKADIVSAADYEDDYKFTLAKPGTIHAQLSPYLGGDSNLQLIQDKNHNNVIDSGDVIAASFNPGHTTDSIFKSLAAGTYFLRVVHNQSDGPSVYELTMVADLIGNTISTAYNAGAITGKTVTFNDYIQQNYGPNSDTDDFYKFTVTKTGTFTAQTTGVAGEDLDIQLISDKNKNGKIDPGEVLATSSHKNSPFEKITKTLTAGTYYLRVFGVNGDTNYTLTMTA
jgi:hypothetical protein